MAFEGIKYRLADNWFEHLPISEFKDKPISYLEIGVFYGANLFSVCDSYAQHKDSKVYGIDPWIEYDQYEEYKGEQESIYKTFQKNLDNRIDKDKIKIFKDFSYNQIHKLPDNFDLIYIDGNHHPDYVLEDAVLCFRKLKSEGYLIFDDYLWPETRKGIYSFVVGYEHRIKEVKLLNHQLLVQKK